MALIAVGRKRDAEQDLIQALEEGAQQRRMIPDEEHRIAFFDQMRVASRDLVLLAAARGEGKKALEYAELGRSQVLLDWLAKPSPAGPKLNPDQTLSQLPKNVSIVEYIAIDNQLLIWVASRGRLNFTVTKLSVADLQTSLQGFVTAVQEGESRGLDAALTRLYISLISPILPLIPEGNKIVFVPDDLLLAIPFAALRDPRTGSPLVTLHAIGISPSILILGEGLGVSRAVIEPQSRALAIGDPNLSAAFPGLPRLSNAREEIALLGASFPSTRCLMGNQATREEFLGQAGKYEIVHFAGHAIADRQDPMLSRLLFAPAREGESGALYARDLLGHRFDHTRLVVLSGCSTGSSSLARSEAIASLAWPFLAAGVPSVVANLWDVHDRPAIALFKNFYRHLHEKRDVLIALQASQLDAMRAGVPPQAWSSLEVICGRGAI